MAYRRRTADAVAFAEWERHQDPPELRVHAETHNMYILIEVNSLR